MRQHTIWNEKYRSTSLENYICSEDMHNLIQHWTENNDIPHLVLHGTAGVGKTTLAKLLVNNMNCDFLYVNASDERGIDTIREKVTSFASTSTFKSIKIVILDESDYLTTPAQASLRNTIETFSKTTRFILTCNYVERIIEPLQSRCKVIHLNPPSKKEVAQHVCDILDQESITYELKDLAQIVQQYYPDIRKIINTCQISCINNTLSLSSDTLNKFKHTDALLDQLVNPTKNSWKNIRQILADNYISDYTSIYRFLYDNIETYSKDNLAEVTICLGEYSFKDVTSIDKEINFMSCVSKILNTIK